MIFAICRSILPIGYSSKSFNGTHFRFVPFGIDINSHGNTWTVTLKCVYPCWTIPNGSALRLRDRRTLPTGLRSARGLRITRSLSLYSLFKALDNSLAGSPLTRPFGNSHIPPSNPFDGRCASNTALWGGLAIPALDLLGKSCGASVRLTITPAAWT